jgi:hypothetical protein
VTETHAQANSLESGHTAYTEVFLSGWLLTLFFGEKNMHLAGLRGSLLYLQHVSIYIYNHLKTWILLYIYSLPAHS